MRPALVVVVVLVGCGDPEVPVVADGAIVDVLPASCSDGLRNGDETDTDCGGGCGGCADGDSCAVDHDCAEGTCFAGTCATRTWFVESTGNNVAVPGNMTWVEAPGLTTAIQLRAPSLVFLRWSGTSRFVGGGNEICHLGQRFVIDGTPTGDTTWGSALLVQRGATRWHDPFLLEMAVFLDAGSHTIAAEMINGAGSATCNLDGDGGLPYDRSRLSIAAYDPATASYAESTGSTGALAGPSPWVDIPGLSVSIPVADVRMFQVSFNGTQFAQNGTVGHCAYRLVVDNTPLGDGNHGQAISVGDVAGGWWAPVAITWGVALNAGTHTFKAQVRNSGGASGTCEAGAGNNGYAKFRLFVTASPIGISQAIESTGGSQYLGASSAWTPINGAQTSLNTGSRAAKVQIEVAGTQRTVSGSGHCAYRLVLDGTPLGHTDHGLTIDVGDGTNAWWSWVGLTWGTRLAPGQHTIRVEVRNSGTTGDCGVNGDDLPYGRVRMLVRSP